MKKLLSLIISLTMLSCLLATPVITYAGSGEVTGDVTEQAGDGGGGGGETEDASMQNDTDIDGDASTDHDSTVLDSFDVTQYLTTDGQNQTYLESDDENSPIIQFILLVIKFLSQLIGTASMVLIVIGGLLMLASEGDDNRIQKGKTIILQAIIGLVLALSSYILVTFVQSLLYVST